MFLNNKTSSNIKLPSSISKKWTINKIISSTSEKTIFELQSKDNHINILYAIPSSVFSKSKYKNLKNCSNQYLVLPQIHIANRQYHFLLFPKVSSLPSILTETGLTQKEFLSLGVDLTFAVEELKKHNIMEADISPTNIYINEHGNYCLGDLNFTKHLIIGTPGYQSPEQSKKEKLTSTEQFDFSMQYSICSLLRNIYELNSSSKEDILESIFEKGCQTTPRQRFSNVAEMRKKLSDFRSYITSENDYTFYHIKDKNHSLFRIKTLSIQQGNKKNFYPALWICMIVFGCVFLSFFYVRLNATPKDTYSYANNVSSVSSQKYTNKENDTTDTPNITEKPTKTTAPQIEPTITSLPVEEIDVQKQNLSDFSSLLKAVPSPENLRYLYAGENKFSDLDAIEQFSNLKEIYLNQNSIKNIASIENLNHVDILVLSYNDIHKIHALKSAKKLKYLDLSSNQSFDDFLFLKSLNKKIEVLNLSNTSISKSQCLTLQKLYPSCKIIF